MKLYQMFKLPDKEARAVQDKIYALEAKQEKDDNAARQKLIDDAINWLAQSCQSQNRVLYTRTDAFNTIIAIEIDTVNRAAYKLDHFIHAAIPKETWEMTYGDSADLKGDSFEISGITGGKFTISYDGRTITQIAQDGHTYTFTRQN